VRHTLQREVAELSNADVEWDGNWLGLWPNISHQAEAIRATGVAARPFLRKALADPQRYIAAHVLLTMMSETPFCLSGEAFNGLKVNLYADGRTEIADQRGELQK